MNFLFDNNLPPNWAATFSAASKRVFSQDAMGAVCHLRDRFAADAPDLEWLSQLGSERNWVVISGDKFRKQNGSQRQAIRRYGLSVFILQPSWASKPYWEKSAQLMHWWPRIVDQANAIEGSTLEVPWRLSSRLKQI